MRASARGHQPTEVGLGNVPDVGVPVAGHAEADQVVHGVGVLGVGEFPDGNDVVDVGVPPEVVPGGAADPAGVAVAVEGGETGPAPPLVVVDRTATYPVGVALAGERFGEPLLSTLFATTDAI